MLCYAMLVLCIILNFSSHDSHLFLGDLAKGLKSTAHKRVFFVAS